MTWTGRVFLRNFLLDLESRGEDNGKSSTRQHLPRMMLETRLQIIRIKNLARDEGCVWFLESNKERKKILRKMIFLSNKKSQKIKYK